MDLDPRLEQDPAIIFLRQCQEEERAEATFNALLKSGDAGRARLAADRLTALHEQTMAYVGGEVEPYRDSG
jgi:hypothetical protein